MNNTQLHSDAWFSYNLATQDGKPVPEPIAEFSKAVCRRFNIRGICDPMYIANVTAFECGMGDGCSTFECNSVVFDEAIRQALINRLMFSYSSSIPVDAREEIYELLLSKMPVQALQDCCHQAAAERRKQIEVFGGG